MNWEALLVAEIRISNFLSLSTTPLLQLDRRMLNPKVVAETFF